MDIDVNKVKAMAVDAVDAVTKNETAKATVNKVIDEAEKKTKVDLPDVDTIAKAVKEGGKLDRH
ncbi:MAG: hypothetical protein J5685_10975 [Clostridiales bacterium]|nr:hypothetical protein [Clostridiales bacterium]